ncbi:MAG: 2-hydroxyacid dehydrogenase [Lachnospiraceae bacterium]|nr:2-hydroxyacid dehydrogenase [Lachnospiraceae bacterium]
MKIMFYDSKPYDKIWFQPMGENMGFKLKFQEVKLNEDTAILARNYDAVCIFVNDDANQAAIQVLKEVGVRTILLRCSGFNNVDLKAAQNAGIQVLRVPSYSPEAVAEYAMGLLLAVNRQIHRAYVRTRDFNYNINGLMGIDLVGKTAGVIGTGKIGQMMIDILKGFKMRILAYDPYPVDGLGVEYVDLDRLFEQSDVISLHCPLTKDSRHIINKKSISKMKDGVILVNTSRGALIHTPDLIDALMERKFTGVGLDVYEEEDEYFFEDKSNEIIQDEDLIRLTSFRNVVLTSHQAFFTKDAMEAIARVTLENAKAVEEGRELTNLVLP